MTPVSPTSAAAQGGLGAGDREPVSAEQSPTTQTEDVGQPPMSSTPAASRAVEEAKKLTREDNAPDAGQAQHAPASSTDAATRAAEGAKVFEGTNESTEYIDLGD